MLHSKSLFQSTVAGNQLEEVATGISDAQLEHEIAARHLRAAVAIQDLDPIGAYQLCYDAARKSVQAVLAANGLRVTSQGGHFTFVRISRCEVFTKPEWAHLALMRLIRNQLEYPNPDGNEITSANLLDALSATEAMLEETRAALFD